MQRTNSLLFLSSESWGLPSSGNTSFESGNEASTPKPTCMTCKQHWMAINRATYLSACPEHWPLAPWLFSGILEPCA
jgi:hypothetical protein